MSLSHITVKKILRSQGRSMVDIAACHAGQKLLDESQGVEFDYSQKEGVVYSEILTPEGAPAWMKDRATLWNAVEHMETRENAHLAREFIIAMPAEFSLAQRIQLLKSFCQNQFVNKGMVADMSLYLAPANHPEAHVLLTTRDIRGKGFGFKSSDWYRDESVSKYHKALANLTQMISINSQDSS
jgi:hypothetical protein